MIGAGEGYNVEGKQLWQVSHSGGYTIYKFGRADQDKGLLTFIDANDSDGELGLEKGDLILVDPEYNGGDAYSTQFGLFAKYGEQANIQISAFNEQLPGILEKAANRFAKSVNFFPASGIWPKETKEMRTKTWRGPGYFSSIAAVDFPKNGKYEEVSIVANSGKDKLEVIINRDKELLTSFNDIVVPIEQKREEVSKQAEPWVTSMMFALTAIMRE